MSRTVSLEILKDVRIASPCHVSWDEMRGDDKIRHCAQCDLHVHNISAMTADEAVSVLERAREGRVCAGFFRRADGTILVQDCPVGLAAIRRRARNAAARAVSALVVLIGASIAFATGRDRVQTTARVSELRAVDWLAEAVGRPRARWTAGLICPPPLPSRGPTSNGSNP